MSSTLDMRSIDDLRRDVDYGKNKLEQLENMSQEYEDAKQAIRRDSAILQEKLLLSHHSPNGVTGLESSSLNQNQPASWANVNLPSRSSSSRLQSGHMSADYGIPRNGFDSFDNTDIPIYPDAPFGQHDKPRTTTSGGFTNQFLQDSSDNSFVPQPPVIGDMSNGSSTFPPHDPSASSLQQPPVASLKRPQSRLSNLWKEERASKRPSPSPVTLPGLNDPPSPASFNQAFDESELMELLGVTAKDDFEAIIQAHREAEEEFQMRKERERQDEACARQYQPLDEYGSSRPSSSMSAGPSGTSALYTPQTQTSASPQTNFGSSLPNGNRVSAPYHMKQAADVWNSGNTLNSHQRTDRLAPISRPALGGPEIIDLVDSEDDVDGGNLSALMKRPNAPNHHTETENHLSPFPADLRQGVDKDASDGLPHFDSLQSDYQLAGSSSSAANPYHGAAGTGVYNYSNAYGASNGQEVKDEQGLLGTLGQGIASGVQGIYNTANTYLRNVSDQILANGHAYANGLPGSFDSPLLVENMGNLDHMTPNQRELYQDLHENLRRDPVNTAEEINSLLANIRPDQDIPPQQRTGTPASMSRSSALYEHQKLGLAWMVAQEEGSNKGGILADDMGLGKTVQALALMVSRRSDNPQCKTNLIIAPVALLKQWEREISVRLRPEKEHCLSTFIYHGQTIKTPYSKLKTFDVVLTSFGTLASELKRKEEQDYKKAADPNWRPSDADVLPMLGGNSKWYRVILDEAQNIKNRGTRAAKATYQLQSQYRFCLTGTPMMNGINELQSLIHFLRIKPYNVVEKFNTEFLKPLKGHSPSAKEKAMTRLRALLKAILLRRTKKSLVDGKPIIILPERTTEVVHTVFSEDENAFYKALAERTRIAFNKYLKAGTVGKNYSNVLVLLLRLRQACCHPHLIKNHAEPGAVPGDPAESNVANAQLLAPDVVKRIIEQGASECPICMDTAENAIIFVPCGHSTCSECYARISDPAQAEREGMNNGFKCPHDRGMIVFGQVTDYATFKKIHMADPENHVDDIDIPGFGQDGNGDGDATDSNSDSDTDSESNSDEGSDLGGFVVPDDADPDATASEDEDGSESATNKRKAKSAKKASKKAKKNKRKAKGKEVAKIPLSKKSLVELKKESLKSAKAKRHYLKRLEKEWITSAKIDKALEILRGIAEKGKEKTIVFSQFTSLLDLLEIPIAREDWGYRRFDGSMSSAQRNNAVIDFADDPTISILLVSLKAGNSGLNLTAASQVILFDPFWNPYIEEQAIDRAHRIGQRLPVQVHRILVPETVEDRIIALQEKKRALIEGALDEKASRDIGRLGTRELAYLFGVTTRH